MSVMALGWVWLVKRINGQVFVSASGWPDLGDGWCPVSCPALWMVRLGREV